MRFSRSARSREAAVTEWPFIAVAYGLTWAVLAGYGIQLVRKRARVADRLERVLNNEGGVQ